MKKKVFNNVFGLGHKPFDLKYLKYIETTNPDGIHHIQNQIQILENTFTLHIDTNINNSISLIPMITKIKSFN